ncbi:hypothetical protein Stube_06050 [Streptomyces tubercidicus]|uniref:Uncharacterized protein n=1 Tax=Streptomyces tubercidicus TaxID=47759 RepID=A0A640UKQ6_9ACTN|nr:hypothetical protein Stube_06050 [Streptomyces tubercidicus]
MAVTVTGCPADGEAGVEVRVTAQLGAAPTVTVAVPVTPVQVQVVLAEVTVAVTTLAPAGRVLVVTLACPEALVTPSPRGPPVVLNRTLAPATGAPPQVTVAVRVTGCPAVGEAGVDDRVTAQLGAVPTVTVAVAVAPTQVQVVVAAITVAVTTLAPAGRVLVVTLATPDALVTPVPRGPAVVLKRTVAPGTGAPPQVTVAVRVTGCPAVGEAGVEVRVTAQFCRAATVTFTLAEMPTQVQVVVAAMTVAVTTLRPVGRLLVVRVACPAAVVTPTPNDPAVVAKRTVAPATGAPPQVTVAVRVTGCPAVGEAGEDVIVTAQFCGAVTVTVVVAKMPTQVHVVVAAITVAVTTLAPVGRVLVVRVACPAALVMPTPNDPAVVAKRTVAPATGAPPQVTVAVRVTGCPAVGEAGEDVIVTAQFCGAATVTFTLAETPTQVQVVVAAITVAVTTLRPVGRVLVVRVACPAAVVTPTPNEPAVVAKRTVAPSTGVPPQVTVAVKVTGCPAVGLAGEDVIVTTQFCGAVTVTLTVAETPTQVQVVVAAITVAVTTLRPVGRVLVVRVACPAAVVTPTPNEPAVVAKRTVAPSTGVPPQVTVAVKVTGCPAVGLAGEDVTVTTQSCNAVTVTVAVAAPLVAPAAVTAPDTVPVKVTLALPLRSATAVCGSAAS